MSIRKLLLVDDQDEARNASLDAIASLVPRERVVTARNAAEAMGRLSEGGFDAAFLDIDMPDADGFSLAGYIESHFPGLPYVFLTGYANFAARSYDYEPLDFLTKPINVVRLQRTFEKLEKRTSGDGAEPPPGKVGIETDDGFLLLDPAEVRAVVRDRRKVKLLCGDGREYVVSHSMEELEVILTDFRFFRCHQSCLVPLARIARVRRSAFGQTYEAVLEDGETVPVSRAKYPLLREELEKLNVKFI